MEYYCLGAFLNAPRQVRLADPQPRPVRARFVKVSDPSTSECSQLSSEGFLRAIGLSSLQLDQSFEYS
jgi:hypothetical protein